MTANISDKQRSEWFIESENELRCETPENETIIIKLIEGNAEIFGIEMALNKEYIFCDENFAIFSWYGCKLESFCSTKTIGSLYKANTTPMIAYVNTHAQLEARRDVALANHDFGPRVLVVGDVDHGKSTICLIFQN